jgi:hypothetical chaperone protein
MSGFCGLDFGTSNSTVGVVRHGQPMLLPLEGGKATLPSSLFFNFEDDRTYFGRAALSEYLAGSQGRLLRALKSVLGSRLMAETTQIKYQQLAFVEILGRLLGHLKHQAETAAGYSLSHVVLGRPVRFDDDDLARDSLAQQQLEAAARAQGFQHIEFQYEPIAAALDYEQQVEAEELALIADIGGGTADFAVVRLAPTRRMLPDRRADILASAGVHVGGTDFDKLLSLARVMPHLGLGSLTREKGTELPRTLYQTLATWHRINSLYHGKTLLEVRQLAFEAAEPAKLGRLLAVLEHKQGHTLALAVEAAKLDLTHTPTTMLRLALADGEMLIPFTQAELNLTLAEAFGRIATAGGAALQQAQISPTQIQALFLTGGSSAIPALRQQLASLVPHAKVVSGDLLGSVGVGLALEAQRRFA